MKQNNKKMLSIVQIKLFFYRARLTNYQTLDSLRIALPAKLLDLIQVMPLDAKRLKQLLKPFLSMARL